MSDAPTENARVTTLELFFDLVFVFAITQLTTVLLRDPTARGLLRVALMLGVIWWMYAGYAWLTNEVRIDRVGPRLLLLAGMAAYLILALAIPRAFTDGGAAFGLSYAAIVAVHTYLFTRTSSAGAVRAILRIAPFNLAAALLILLAGVGGGTAEYVLWAGALALEWATPRLRGNAGFEIAPAHFVERHGLVVLIAIGESVVSIGTGVVGMPVDAHVVIAVVLGLALSACLWWAYFGGDDRRAEHALEETGREGRPGVALIAFGYCHLLMLLGIIVVAAAVRAATGHSLAPLAVAQALELGGGIALFALGELLFRRSLGIGPTRWRAAIALLAPATIPLGLGVTAVAQLAALVALLAAVFAAEHLTAKKEHA